MAPTGTPADLVEYQPIELDGNDDFSVSVPAGSEPQDVYLKACFDGRCEVTTTTV